MTAPTDPDILAAILDSATDYAIIALDRNNKITSWNVGARNILGWQDDEVIGRSGELIFIEEDRSAGVPETEIRRALADGRAVDERWHARRDGSRFWGSGLLMPLRGNTGFVKIMRDETQRRAAEQRLRESEERFRTLALNIPQLVWRSYSLGERSWGSPQWVAYAGLSEQNSLGLGWLDAVHPEDREASIEAFAKAEVDGELYVEHRIRRAIDGQYRWFQSRARRLAHDSVGRSEWFGTSTDIDDLRRLKERQELLVRELHHRSGNLMAIIASIARRTVQRSISLADFAERFDERLLALARVQNLIAVGQEADIELGELIKMEIHAHGIEVDGKKITVDGPPFTLSSRQAETLAVALHELTTNALKYGAISRENGRLRIVWSRQPGTAIAIEWHETGLSDLIVDPNGKRGFGLELIEVAVPHALGARTRVELRAREGFIVSSSFPELHTLPSRFKPAFPPSFFFH